MTALACCQPFHAAGAWRHGQRCRHRGEKLTMEERRKLRAARYLERVVDDEPAAITTAVGRLATWYGHPVGCSCDDCSYVDAHLDDG